MFLVKLFWIKGNVPVMSYLKSTNQKLRKVYVFWLQLNLNSQLDQLNLLQKNPPIINTRSVKLTYKTEYLLNKIRGVQLTKNVSRCKQGMSSTTDFFRSDFCYLYLVIQISLIDFGYIYF